MLYNRLLERNEDQYFKKYLSTGDGAAAGAFIRELSNEHASGTVRTMDEANNRTYFPAAPSAASSHGAGPRTHGDAGGIIPEKAGKYGPQAA